MPETRTRYHYHPRKRQRTLADCGVAVAKQEAGLNDTSSDLVTRGKERRNPEDEMEAGAPLQEEMITRKVDDQVGNTGGGGKVLEPRGREGNWSPPEVEKNTQEEPGDPLYPKQVGDTGGRQGPVTQRK